MLGHERKLCRVHSQRKCQTAFVGNSKWKMVPLLLPAVTQIRPLWFSMIEWQMERPIPMPWSLVVNSGLEDLTEVGGINSNPGILDRHLYTIVPVQFGFYGQHTRLYRPHGIDGIHDQIQNDLLQLDLIAKHRRNSIVEFRFKIDPMFPQIDVDQLQNCPDQFVDIDRRFVFRVLSEHRPDVRDDVACAVTRSLNLIQRGSRLVNIRSFPLRASVGLRWPLSLFPSGAD